MLAPAHGLLEDVKLWQDPAGLALFLSRDEARHLRLPRSVEETLAVGLRFHVLPVIAAATEEEPFLVLALSPKRVRLFAADGDRAEEIDLPGVPTRLTDVVGSDWEQESVQMHTAGPGAAGAIAHGHGGQGEIAKQETARFCRRVDDALGSLLNKSRRPLVLAAAEPLTSIYRQVSRIPALTRDGISGNPDLLSGEELRQRGARLLAPLRARQLEAELERCRRLLGTGLATSDLSEIVTAASDGRVDTLFLSAGARKGGTWDAVTRRVEIRDQPGPESEDLCNLAAVLTARSRGTVRVAPSEALGEAAPAAAIFRY
jgi:hypothetical protein